MARFFSRLSVRVGVLLSAGGLIIAAKDVYTRRFTPLVNSSPRPSTRPREERAFDVIIVGAGAIGLYSSIALARKGYSVAVVDAGDVGGGLSSVAPALLPSVYYHLQRAIRQREPGMFRSAVEAAREELHWRRVLSGDKHGGNPQVIRSTSTFLPLSSYPEFFEACLAVVGTVLVSLYAVGEVPSFQYIHPSRFRTESERSSGHDSQQTNQDKVKMTENTTATCTEFNRSSSYFCRFGGIVVPGTQIIGTRGCVALAQTAEQCGVTLFPYHAVKKITLAPRTNTPANSSPISIVIDNITCPSSLAKKDKGSRTTLALSCDCLINCSGPWIDAVSNLIEDKQRWIAEASMIYNKKMVPLKVRDLRRLLDAKRENGTIPVGAPTPSLPYIDEGQYAADFPRANRDPRELPATLIDHVALGSKCTSPQHRNFIYFVIPKSDVFFWLDGRRGPLPASIDGVVCSRSGPGPTTVSLTPFGQDSYLVGQMCHTFDSSEVPPPLIADVGSQQWWNAFIPNRNRSIESLRQQAHQWYYNAAKKHLFSRLEEVGLSPTVSNPIAVLSMTAPTLHQSNEKNSAAFGQLVQEVGREGYSLESPLDQWTFPLVNVVGGNWSRARVIAEDIGDFVVQQKYLKPLKPLEADRSTKFLQLGICHAPQNLDAANRKVIEETSAETELRRIVREEFVTKLTDVVGRRTLAAYINPYVALKTLKAVGTIVGDELRWSPERLQCELLETENFIRNIAVI